MSPEQKRVAVAKAYPGAKWAQKVQKMSDAQVHTIHMRIINKTNYNTISSRRK
ncbi:hypothetical protein SEA_SLOOPYJOE_51 [Arthrobacter phage Sloopyjoe]|nr:hypothetical protein PBI_STAYER_51 [Arthrobacter phage Stayer]QFG09758.1 hypothetical protein PBI_SHIBA_50 [Arthrobacter phage Shiba]QFG11765.1 hypothetical protein PBI_SALK_51 [Arthrobacter phage Salk]QFG12647.1 hypothetical protein PBI_MICHELLE_51 [Arthrobacter phage Michelle]QFG14420.1 hypothetical protein PBI_STARLORD_51 [Arthrobacter phage StarLord]UVT31129.1 hypothetical protein PBI_LINDA_51 [Arthrobacter phage Linda]WAB09467.1 hypothetical protein SEA_SLOOPYJOE_51 [Arthrobacter phag